MKPNFHIQFSILKEIFLADWWTIQLAILVGRGIASGFFLWTRWKISQKSTIVNVSSACLSSYGSQRHAEEFDRQRSGHRARLFYWLEWSLFNPIYLFSSRYLSDLCCKERRASETRTNSAPALFKRISVWGLTLKETQIFNGHIL